MIVPDVNVVLYAHIDGFADHAAWRAWWHDAVNGGDGVGIPEAVLFGFLRVSTSPRVFRVPLAVDEALTCVEGWLAQPTVRLLVHSAESVAIAARLVRTLGTAGNLTTDVQIAALAIHHQALVCSRDTDFGRFPGLRWRNPLAT